MKDHPKHISCPKCDGTMLPNESSRWGYISPYHEIEKSAIEQLDFVCDKCKFSATSIIGKPFAYGLDRNFYIST